VRALSSILAVPVLLLASSAAFAEEPRRSPLVRPLGKAAVDWGTGLVSARGRAAADLRMPGPEAARADAVRDASIRARETLRLALARLPLGKKRRVAARDLEAALARATIVTAEYQSNGGVFLALGVRFDDLRPAAPASAKGDRALVLSVASMPFEAAPVVSAGDREIPLVQAVYRLGKPPRSERAVSARRDRQGRLMVPARALADRREAPTRAVIYLRSAPRR
jgi:hypothetical protein